MRSLHVCGRVLTLSLVVSGIGLWPDTVASADQDQPQPSTPSPPAVTVPADGGAPEAATTACKQFAAALRVSSAYYNKFAYSIAGEGAHVDYQDPAVSSRNVDGRTALRKSAAEALMASGTPRLQPEIAAPMRSWSLRATRLLITMGLHLDGNALNDAASDLNTAADTAQMACVAAGAQPMIRGSSGRP